MPRFTEDEMKRAVLKVTKDGLSVNRVAKEDGLCKKTLKSYVDKYLSCGGGPNKEIRFRPNYEINQVFTNQHEQVFEEHLIAIDRTQQKITRDYVRKAAYDFATKCNVHVPKTWNVRKQAGLDWMYGYLNRHPNIKAIIVRNKKNKAPIHVMSELITDENGIVCIEDIRIKNEKYSSDDESDTEVTVVGQISASDDYNLENFDHEDYLNLLFENENDAEKDDEQPDDDNYLSKISVKSPLDEFLENLTDAYGLIAEGGFVDAERVYNLGEIALIVEDPSAKSKPILVTACCLINAVGCCLSPFFVFPRQKFRRSMLKGLPDGVDGTARPDGRLDDDSFMLVLEHFQDIVKASPSKKVILIMDDDDCHITINSLDFCEENGIELVTLPPHYGPNLQPTERYVFPAVRYLFNHYVDRVRAVHQRTFNMFHVALLFCQLESVAFTPENVSMGFSETGIFPLNDHVFNKSEFHVWKASQYAVPSELPEITLDFSSVYNEVDPACEDVDNVEENLLVKVEPITEEPCSTSNTAYTTMNKTPMEEFFNNLVEGYGELEMHGGIKSDKVYNLDEIEILIGTNRVSYNTPRISICCYANAAGRSLPPFLVYPEDEFVPQMLDGGVPGMKGTASTDGRINNAIFMSMLKHFQQQVAATPSDRVLLILDCEDYHISLSTMDFCEENGIVMVTVPPHISEPFQPLEKTAFKTLPVEFHEECLEYMRSQNETGISIFDIAALLARTFERSFKPEIIVSGFEATGLWPLNHDLFAQDVLCLAYTEKPTLEEEDESSIRKSVSQMVFDVEEDDEDNMELDSDSDDSSLMSNDDVIQFYNAIENFVKLADEDSVVNERIYVLGETRLETASIVANVMMFVNVMGCSLPPFLIYSTKSKDDALLESSLGITGYRSEKDLVDENTFLKALEHFHEHAYSSEQCKMLVLVKNEDMGGSIRVTSTIRELSGRWGIILETLPTIGGEVLHPLENSFMKTLKERFNEAKADARSEWNSINDVVSFLEQIFIELFVAEEISNKFKEYGICSTKTNGRDFQEEESEEEKTADDRGEDGVVDENKKEESNLEDFIIEEEIEMTYEGDEWENAEKTCSRIMFLCGICEATFVSSEDLQEHEKKSKCRYCDLACCSMGRREQHERSHMNGSLHRCPFCDKECISRTALIQHRKIHRR